MAKVEVGNQDAVVSELNVEHCHRLRLRFDAVMRTSSPTVGSSGSETAAGGLVLRCYSSPNCCSS
jgi:hypothetical protein